MQDQLFASALTNGIVVIFDFDNRQRTPPMSHALFEKLTPDHLVLTANSRLTRYLQTTLDEYQLNQKKQTWETPAILPLTSWLEQQFHLNNKADAILLNAFQELCIWEKIIAQSNLASEVMHPAQLAELVKEAWEILTLWKIPLETLEPFSTQHEVDCLIKWISEFKKHCAEKNWVTAAEIPTILEKKSLSIKNKIWLMGFDDFNPALETLFTQLKKTTSVETKTLEIPSNAQQVILDNTESELIAMAEWIKSAWKKNPTGKYGCVIPELEKMRGQVERVFTHVFCIEKIIPGIDAPMSPFNISAGIPLSHNALIHTALTLLQWCIKPLPIQQLAAILQSPYLCATEEDACIGAQLDAILRDKNQLHVTISDLFTAIPKIQSQYSNNTGLTRWRTLLQFSREKNGLLLMPSEWAQELIQLLKSIHWPGERTQTTDEFQALEKFKKGLFEFSKLDLTFDKINLAQAFHLLYTQTQKIIFQAKSHNEPIQIMGTLEASSILFDAAWIMGLHDGIWPAATKPHPLIPHAIQQQHNMPHATAERELQFCDRMTKRLENSAKQVIFSSPEKEGDQLLFPSRLIHSIPMISRELFTNQHTITYAEKIFATKKSEFITEDNATAISDFSSIRGGSHILKLQALCPYQAFAKIRLKAKALNEPTLGIPAITKGVIIHQILFEIWNYLKDQTQLLNIANDVLETLMTEKIDKALSENIAASTEAYHDALIAIEKKRLHMLIQNWLHIEKSRSAFRVKSLEMECEISIKQLTMKVRLDRVDELADGSLLLIDYKTGENNIQTILQERLTNPQLPLYTAFQDKNENAYQGVAFAEIRNANMIYRGITHENRKEKKEDAFQLTPIHETKNKLHINEWETLIDSWKKSLETLADDFCQGNSAVDPIEKSTCDNCGLQSVCRLQD